MQNQDRRDFLKAAALGTTAVVSANPLAFANDNKQPDVDEVRAGHLFVGQGHGPCHVD